VTRALVVLALVVGGALGVKSLGDATQTRPDVRDGDRMTEVVIRLEGQNYRQGLDTAADALWGTCAATVSGDLVEPGVEPLGAGRYRLAMTPSLGDHGKERLLGCLADLTVDRLRSSVESVADVPRRG
jgi:hypothetical protein